jgi:ferrous iron transport protein B
LNGLKFDGLYRCVFCLIKHIGCRKPAAGVLTNLISQGIIPGIGGILIFIPQIAFLFMFISILEESGYMSRVVFLMDKIMRKFGLSAKCGAAYFWNCLCYSCYNGHKKHRNWKERLITILVTPFTTCSA